MLLNRKIDARLLTVPPALSKILYQNALFVSSIVCLGMLDLKDLQNAGTMKSDGAKLTR